MTNIRYARAQCVCTLNTSGATLSTQQEQEKVGVWSQHLDFWQEKKYECQSKDLTFYEMSKSRHQMISIGDTGGKDVHQHLHFWQEKNQI